MSHSESASQWNKIYKPGAATAVSVVLTALIEMIITFLPGGGDVNELSATRLRFSRSI